MKDLKNKKNQRTSRTFFKLRIGTLKTKKSMKNYLRGTLKIYRNINWKERKDKIKKLNLKIT